MFWLDKHARFRHSLSPYVDGRLTPREVVRLEAHLDSCGDCRNELDELRATASALRDLPDVEAPRSFVLTPQMLERRAMTPAPSVPPLAVGMRLASAAVAVVLAVVVIGDLSDEGNGGNGEREAASEQAGARTTAEFGAGGEEPAATNHSDLDAQADNRNSSVTPVPPAESATASCPPSGEAGPASGGGIGGPVAPGATPSVTPSAETPPESAAAEAGAACDDTAAGAAARSATATPEDSAPATDEGVAGEALAAASDDGGGVSALRVLELALAGSLVALLTAVVVEFALRRQKAV